MRGASVILSDMTDFSVVISSYDLDISQLYDIANTVIRREYLNTYTSVGILVHIDSVRINMPQMKIPDNGDISIDGYILGKYIKADLRGLFVWVDHGKSEPDLQNYYSPLIKFVNRQESGAASVEDITTTDEAKKDGGTMFYIYDHFLSAGTTVVELVHINSIDKRLCYISDKDVSLPDIFRPSGNIKGGTIAPVGSYIIIGGPNYIELPAKLDINMTHMI